MLFFHPPWLQPMENGGWNRDRFNPNAHTHRIHGAGILTYIWLRFMVNVKKYTRHGACGTGCLPPSQKFQNPQFAVLRTSGLK